MNSCDKKFMLLAVMLSRKGMMKNEGGPFGAVIVKNNKIVGKGFNRVISKKDPTNHAEIIAIKNASHKLKSFDLSGCTIYTSAEPCPMCLGAIYWAHIRNVFYGNARNKSAKYGFDDAMIYRELGKKINQRKIKFKQIMSSDAEKVLIQWKNKIDKTPY